MTETAVSLANLAVAVLVGAIVFHSAVVAPTVFRQLDEVSARRFLRTIFPRFYWLGLCCGVIATVALSVAAFGTGSVFIQACLAAAILIIILEVASLRLTPLINAARDAGEAQHARFARLHRLSVLLTLVALVLGTGILLALPASI
ncbi:DUF4149 domain-containing protein [Lentisalinibacter sediminis]|uniref:DUF4149 domain-containing protein n=1 Tax=Lentisalinibacter sediminis TaxID=2992237 RepID=UPI00386C690E